jgi:putative DNA primase/helicase
LDVVEHIPRLQRRQRSDRHTVHPIWFRKSFLGNEDPELTERLLGELPGILNRLMRALRRLRERGKFRVPASAKRVVEIMEDEASPIRAFARECCELSPEFGELCDTVVFRAYAGWCAENGHRPMSKTRFRHKLMEAVHSVDVLKPGPRGSQQWTCVGLKLNSRGWECVAVVEAADSDRKAARVLKVASRLLS